MTMSPFESWTCARTNLVFLPVLGELTDEDSDVLIEGEEGLVVPLNLKQDKPNRVEDEEGYWGHQVDQPSHGVLGAVHNIHDGQSHSKVIGLSGEDSKESCPRNASVEEEV